MDYRLSYTRKALSDFAEIIGYIAQDDADTASRFGNSLTQDVWLLAALKHMGSVVPKRKNVRKLLRRPFLIYYRVREAEKAIEILHIGTERGSH